MEALVRLPLQPSLPPLPPAQTFSPCDIVQVLTFLKKSSTNLGMKLFSSFAFTKLRERVLLQN